MKNLTILAVVLSLFLVGCSDEKESAPAAQMPPLPVKVTSVKIERASLIKEYSAILKPFNEVDIVARVSGLLLSKKFQEGAYVKAGDILYEIEKHEYTASLNEATASLLKAEANFSKAEKDWKRNEYLFKNNAISAEQSDNLFYAYENAKAEVKKAKAVVENAQIKFDYTTIKAPISGTIGISSNDVGSYINVSGQNAKLATITALEPVYAEFSLPNSDIEKYLSQIKNGTKVVLTIGMKNYDGEIDFISPKIDSQTDTLKIRAKFENKSKELVVGSYAEIKIIGLSYERIAKIPQNALLKTQNATIVYAVKDGVLSMKPVKIAHVQDGIAYIEDGVEEADNVIINNIAKLRPNSKVIIAEGN